MLLKSLRHRTLARPGGTRGSQVLTTQATPSVGALPTGRFNETTSAGLTDDPAGCHPLHSTDTSPGSSQGLLLACAHFLVHCSPSMGETSGSGLPGGGHFRSCIHHRALEQQRATWPRAAQTGRKQTVCFVMGWNDSRLAFACSCPRNLSRKVFHAVV